MNNNRALIKNISIYTSGNFIIKISGFLLLPLYSIYLSTADYGIISSMALFGNILFIFITLSLDRSIYRCFFDYKTDEEKKEFIGTITISLLVISTIFVILIIILNKYISLIYKSIPFYPYYFLIILTTYISIFYTISIIYYQVTEQSKKFVLLIISMFFFNIVLTIVFVVFFKRGATGKLIATFIANLIFIPIVFIIIKNHSVFKFKPNILKSALSYSLPIIPTLLSAWVLNLSDRIFIERYYTLQEVGIYSMGYKLAEAILILSSGFFTAYSPMFFRIANSENEKNKIGVLYPINTQFILITLILSFIAFFFAEDIVRIFLHSKFFESYKIFQLIIIAYLFNITFGITNVSFAQNKKMVTIMFISIGCAIMNVFLNFLLIPKYGMYGAAYATIISFALFGIVKYNFAKHYFFVPWAWKKILMYFITISIAIIISKLVVIDSTLYLFVFKVFLTLIVITFYFIDNKKYFDNFNIIKKLINERKPK